MKQYYEIGLLLRGWFRRYCMMLGCEYKEDKGWLDSGFVVEGTPEQHNILNREIDKLNEGM